jgi:hypothetical protein
VAVGDPRRWDDVQPSPPHRLFREPTSVACFVALTGYGDLGLSCHLVSGRFLRARGLERFSGVLPAGIGLTAINGSAG